MKKILLIFIIIITIVSLWLRISIRNGEKIAKKAPEFMLNYNFKLIQYSDFKPHIFYGGFIEYYATYYNIDTFKVTLTIVDDTIMVYDIQKLNKGE